MQTISSDLTIQDSSLVINSSNGINKFNYLAIPFNLNYDLVTKRRTTVGINSEFIYSRLVNSSGNITVADNSELLELNRESSFIKKDLVSIQLGILVDYRLSQSLNLHVTPGYSFSSNQTNQTSLNSKNYNSGGYLRVSLFKNL